MNGPLLFVTAIALIDPQGRVLLAQRPEGKDMAGLWEFPGGKVAPGETPEEALVREMEEELGLLVSSVDLKPLTFVSYAYETFHLFMPLYLCRTWQGQPQPLEGQKLAWVFPKEMGAYAMPPADEPLRKQIEKLA